MSIIEKHAEGTQFYRNLKLASAMMQYTDPDSEYVVEDTYFDFGQDWMWTTIIKKNADNKWCNGVQILCPRDEDRILLADTPEEIAEIVNDIMTKYTERA